MRQTKSIRKRIKRKKMSPVDIDITSLLDILVIMLVFLLKSYNSSGVVLEVPKGISLPKSESTQINTAGIIIQVSPSTIWVDNEVVLSSKKTSKRDFDYGGRRIVPLFNKLVKQKQLIKQVQRSSKNAKKFSGVVNLIIDKSIKYDYIKKILFTCAEAGLRQYKFVVLGEE